MVFACADEGDKVLPEKDSDNSSSSNSLPHNSQSKLERNNSDSKLKGIYKNFN